MYGAQGIGPGQASPGAGSQVRQHPVAQSAVSKKCVLMHSRRMQASLQISRYTCNAILSQLYTHLQHFKIA